MKTEISDLAAALIQAMIVEREAMPKSYQAPKTVDLSGVLRSKLEGMGYNFKEENPVTEHGDLLVKKGNFFLQFADESLEGAIQSHSARGNVYHGFKSIEDAKGEANTLGDKNGTKYKVLDSDLKSVFEGEVFNQDT